MNDLVLKSINEVLFENGSIILPGLGVFETHHKDAQIDQVQGVVHPPAREIAFYENKEKEDNTLLNHLVQSHGLNEEKAKSIVAETVNHTLNQMEKKEIVNFPGLGRMYVDFEKNIQFLPDKTNFSKEAFGLPSLNFYPIVKKKDEVLAEAASTAIPTSPIPPSPGAANQASKSSSDWLTRFFPWLLGLALLLVAVIFFWYWQANQNDDPISKDKIADMDGRVNTSPRNNQVPADTLASNESETENQEDAKEEEVIEEEKVPENQTSPESKPENIQPKENKKQSKPDLPPGMKECVIIVGGFASKENAQQMIREVSKAGYDAYSDKKGGLSRVGVTFLYKNESEIEKKLQELKDKFNSSSWVLKY
jgi:nucleoid DNA-binding protein